MGIDVSPTWARRRSESSRFVRAFGTVSVMCGQPVLDGLLRSGDPVPLLLQQLRRDRIGVRGRQIVCAIDAGGVELTGKDGLLSRRW